MHGSYDQAYEIIAALWQAGLPTNIINTMIMKGIDLRYHRLQEIARYDSSALQKSEAIRDLGYKLDSKEVEYIHSIRLLRNIESPAPQISA